MKFFQGSSDDIMKVIFRMRFMRKPLRLKFFGRDLNVGNSLVMVLILIHWEAKYLYDYLAHISGGDVE